MDEKKYAAHMRLVYNIYSTNLFTDIFISFDWIFLTDF